MDAMPFPLEAAKPVVDIFRAIALGGEYIGFYCLIFFARFENYRKKHAFHRLQTDVDDDQQPFAFHLIAGKKVSPSNVSMYTGHIDLDARWHRMFKNFPATDHIAFLRIGFC